jgi:LCP family protein required for cell wall assembly
MAQKKKRRKKKSIIKSIFKTITVLIVLIIIASIALLIFDPLGIRDITQNNFSTSDKNLNISDEVNFDDNIINIALIGTDKRAGSSQRSDTIVILSYDKQTGRTTLTSIMRDLLVYIPERNTYDKINAAYAYGGEELLLKTINTNLDLNVKYYITVDFSAMEKLVDAVGGVNVDIKPEEISCVNEDILEQHNLLGGETDYISKSGVQLLNGRQALAYCRVRKVGNADWERTSRQRTVINAIINKMKDDMSIKMMISLFKNVAPSVGTNMTAGAMMSLAASYLKHKDTFIIEDFRLPYDHYALDEYYNEIYYLKPNTLKDNVIMLHKYIFGIDEFDPSGDVKEISSYIKNNH